MKKIKLIVAVAAILFISSQCTYHNEEDYFSDPANLCDTVDMSYTTNMVPIFQNNCYACHNSTDRTAGYAMDSYDDLKSAIESGRLLGTIKHEQGYTSMPRFASKLDNCSINQIEAWINQGMPDN